MAELRLNGEMNLLSTRYRVSSDCACRFKRQKWMVEVLRETSSCIGRTGLTGHERELLVFEQLRTGESHSRNRRDIVSNNPLKRGTREAKMRYFAP